MNISLVGRHIELTDAIKNHIESLLRTLEKYHLDIISAKAVVASEEKNGKKGYIVEYIINLAKRNTIVIKQKDKDVYAAADLAIGRAHDVLSKYHEKVTEHQATTLEEINARQIMEDEHNEAFGSDDEIVPTDLELHKPLEIEEALAKLKASKQQFLVFNDMSGKMRVMYKRNDGKFGLY